VDVLAIATDVVHDAQVVAPDRTISLEVDSPAPAVVTGDESRLRQVLHNVMSNALTHTPDGTPIDVTVRTSENPSVATVAIADRGPGIEPAHASRVFERFYRADSSRSRAAGGSGLGLSIVAGLVAAHGGSVGATARDGGGAIFTVSLPLADDRSAAT
jgi:two-component system OmpR family sensor kinase